MFSLRPLAPFPETTVNLVFICSNAPAASIIPGVNTLLLTASATPIPDMVALAATAQNDGVVRIPGTFAIGVFAVATVNVGASGTITVFADTNGVPLPVALSVCQTNPATGECLAAPAPTVTVFVNSNETPTFGVFVAGAGHVVFNPATNRIFLRLTQGGALRGATNVAVATQ